MGFWDRNVENSFDSLFDMNRDGVLDPVEQGFQPDFLARQMEEDDLRLSAITREPADCLRPHRLPSGAAEDRLGIHQQPRRAGDSLCPDLHKSRQDLRRQGAGQYAANEKWEG